MPSLVLESASDTIDLDGQFKNGTGVQVHSGVLGLGLPPVQGQWLEGAGDGATFRGSRVLPRDIDLPLSILGTDREHLKSLTSRLARMVAGACKLRLVEDDGTSWYADVRRIGGGNYTYGVDTVGTRDLDLVLTFRAGDPYWTSETPLQASITKASARGLLPRLVNLKLSGAQAIGSIALDNPGDASAYPVWKVLGPGNNFRAISPTGETLHWEGALLDGEALNIDTKTGVVTDDTGANRYSELAPAPRMWMVPPGVTTSTVSLEDPSDASQITCTWRPRRWMVV